MLRINALGGLALLRDGVPITGEAAQPRRLALLALLGRAGARGLTRDKVLALLWPDTEEERARRTLSQALYALRQGIGSDAAITGTSDLRLDPDVVTSDVAEFEVALREGALELAAALYAGPFLDGFRLPAAAEFDRWVETERGTLAHDYAAVLERLAKDASTQGDAVRASGWWRKRAALDATNPRLAMELMRSLAASGDRAGAVHHARVFTVLCEQDELPVNPAVEALAKELREPLEPVKQAVASTIEPPPPVAVRDPEPAPAAAVTEVAQDAPPAVRTRPRRAMFVIAGGVALAAAAVVAVARPWSARPVADPPGPPTVIVGQIKDYAAEQVSLTHALGDMLATNLARAPGLRVVSAARAQELLQGVSGGSDTTAGAVIAAAQRAGARELIDGALFRLGQSRYRLDLNRTDLSTGALGTSITVEGPDVFALVDSGTARLVAALGAVGPTGSVADVTTHSLVAYRLYVDGLRAYFRGNSPVAHGMFQAALDEDSTFALAAYYSALTESPSERIGPALARAVRLADRASDRERLMIRAAWADAVSSPALGAIAETLATRYPTEVQGPLLSGTARVRAGDFAGAIPYLERAIAMDSAALNLRAGQCGACVAFNTLVSTHALADSWDASIQTARRWARLQPGSPQPWFALAGTYEALSRGREARAAYRAALALDQTVVPDARFSAKQSLMAHEFEEADKAFRALIEDPRARRDAYWFLAISLRMQGRMTEALAASRAYRRASVEDSTIPSITPVLYALGEAQVLLEAGQFRESAALFDSVARASQPAEPSQRARQRVWAFTHATNALAELGDTAALRWHADTVALEAPQSGYGRDRRLHHHIEGLRRRIAGDWRGAAESFRQAIFSPSLGYTRSSLELGCALIHLSRGSDAVAVLQPTLRSFTDGANLYANRTELHEMLAHAWTAAGNADSARTHYRIVATAWAKGDPPFRARADRAEAALGGTRVVLPERGCR